MKRTIIFLSLFIFMVAGVMIGTKDAKTFEKANEVSIIKFHFPRSHHHLGGFYGKARNIQTGIIYSCGPTNPYGACGPDGVPEGTYQVWGEVGPDCLVTETQTIYHRGHWFTDVYLNNYYEPQCY